MRDATAGVYKRVVLKDDKLVGAVLYGETGDGAWFFDLLKRGEDIIAVRDTLIFGQAYQGAAAPYHPLVGDDLGRGDEFHHGSATPDPRDQLRTRDIYIPDLHIDTIKIRTRDFSVTAKPLGRHINRAGFFALNKVSRQTFRITMPNRRCDNRERAMREIVRLAQRRAGKTTCPSEVARALAAANSAPETWRSYMPAVHAAADELNAIGKISLSWKSVAMPARSGPYRIRKSDDRAN